MHPTQQSKGTFLTLMKRAIWKKCWSSYDSIEISQVTSMTNDNIESTMVFKQATSQEIFMEKMTSLTDHKPQY